MSLSSGQCFRLVTLFLVLGCVHSQEVDEYYSRTSYDRYDDRKEPVVNARTFFETCLKIRDSNNYFTEEEQLHHPLLPPPSYSLGNDENYNNNNNIDNNNNKHDLKHVPKFILESQNCTDYRCMANDLQRDPRQLGHITCYSVSTF